jgi:hypothetical protein
VEAERRSHMVPALCCCAEHTSPDMHCTAYQSNVQTSDEQREGIASKVRLQALPLEIKTLHLLCLLSVPVPVFLWRS